jgi:anti-sigma B factor antagonist
MMAPTVCHLPIECDGVLDAVSAAETKRDALRRIDGGSDVVIDLSEIEFIDSVGLGVLVGLFKTIRTRGCRANFIGVRPGVQRVLEIIRLDEIFEVYPDLESATRALARR